MATLTLKNVPDELYRRLKARAARNHRSLNREAIRLLQESVTADAATGPDEAGQRAVAFRAELAAQGVWISADDTLAVIDEGRE